MSEKETHKVSLLSGDRLLSSARRIRQDGAIVDRDPRVEETLKEAYERAKLGMPVFWPIRYYQDDRGYSIYNIFPEVMTKNGQLNMMSIAPGAIKAWHLHEQQIDMWFVFRGKLKIGLVNQKTKQGYVCYPGERNPGIVLIPKNHWHGCVNLTDKEANVIYYMDQIYDRATPDEIKISPDSHFLDTSSIFGGWEYGEQVFDKFWEIWHG